MGIPQETTSRVAPMWKVDGKPVGRCRPPRDVVVIFTLSCIVASIILFTVLINVKIPLQNVDPAILRALEEGRTVLVWVYTWPGADIPRSGLVKVWNFGSFEIALEYVTTIRQLVELSENSWYVGTFENYIVKPPRTPIMLKMSDVELAKRRNYLLEIHNPEGKYNGSGVTIAILDTGIDYLAPIFYTECRVDTEHSKIVAMVSFVVEPGGHPAIWSLKYWREGLNMSLRQLPEWEYEMYERYGYYPFMDIVGHGTAVASVIDASPCYPDFRGVAPGARLVILKIFPDKPTCSIVKLLDALHWIYENYAKYNIKIVSMSLNVFAPAYGEYSNPINIVLHALAEKGILILVAAGNEGNFPGSLDAIGTVSGVYIVGAWNPIDGRIASFTSLPAPGQTPITFLGVGYLAWTYLPNMSMIYQYVKSVMPYLILRGNIVLLSGTSIATPAVAGVLADWYQWYIEKMHREPTPRQLVETACRYGYITGRVPLIVKCGLVRAPER